jgi:hypothetical protein
VASKTHSRPISCIFFIIFEDPALRSFYDVYFIVFLGERMWI